MGWGGRRGKKECMKWQTCTHVKVEDDDSDDDNNDSIGNKNDRIDNNNDIGYNYTDVTVCTDLPVTAQ